LVHVDPVQVLFAGQSQWSELGLGFDEKVKTIYGAVAKSRSELKTVGLNK